MDLPTGGSAVQGAYNQGNSAITGYDPAASANTQNQGFNTLFSSQTGSGPSNATDFMNAYSKQVASNPTVTSLYNSANDMFNVPAQQRQATYLSNQVNQAVPNAYNQARGFDFNDAQVQNQANTNLRFLQPEANAAQANANTASGLASNYVQAGQAQNAQNLLPIQSYQPILQQTLAAQATGFTQDAQAALAGLQAKMSAGVQLSQTEMQQLASLTSAQETYQAAISGQTEALNQAQSTAGVSLSPTQTYYNPYNTAATYNPNRKM